RPFLGTCDDQARDHLVRPAHPALALSARRSPQHLPQTRCRPGEGRDPKPRTSPIWLGAAPRIQISLGGYGSRLKAGTTGDHNIPSACIYVSRMVSSSWRSLGSCLRMRTMVRSALTSKPLPLVSA